MSDRRSYVALDWVNAQISETLQQAVEALEGFVANPQDITKLRFSLTYIHQVSGSLVMIELHAAALLSKEIESLLSRVLENENSILAQTDAAKLVKTTLVSLEEYLNAVAKTHEENPREVLSLLNLIRLANKEEAFSESDIFDPDIAVSRQTEKQQPTIAVEEFNDLIRKLRQSFQTGLIGVVRDKDLENNFHLVNKVCASIHKVSANTASEPLWQIAFAITDQLLHANVPAGIESKKALKQIDNQIKHLEESGREALSESPDPVALKSLLYSVATTDAVTESIAELRKIYRLDRALAQTDIVPAEESLAVQKVVSAIISSLREDIAVLSEFEIVAMNEALQRLGNTCRVLGIEDVTTQLQNIESHINAVVDEGGDISSKAESICQELEALEAFIQKIEARQIKQSFTEIAEKYQQYINARHQGLDDIKSRIAEYAAAQCDRSYIQDLPDMLDEQTELLALSPLARLVPVVTSAQKFVIERLFHSETKPGQQSLEALADAISSVEYYLQRVTADSSENLEALLALAEESIARLANTDSLDAAYPEVEILRNDEAVYDDYSDIPVASVENELADDQDSIVLSLEATDADDIPLALVSSEEVDVNEFPEMALDIQEEIPLATNESETVHLEADELLMFEPGEDADEEILEIFIEEAREVLDHIKEYLPQLEADHENVEALLEIRRGFHTLKGSGRMVGALHIGDFAWSVERMLNSVRDGNAKVTDTAIAILHLAVECVPALIDGMEQRVGVSKNLVQNVILRADAEWEGKPFAEAKVSTITSWAELPAATVEIEAEVPLAKNADYSVSYTMESDSAQLINDELSLDEFADYSLEDTEETDDIGENVDEEPVDAELLEIFIAEAESHIDVLSRYLENIDPGYEDVKVSAELQRAMHTLKGSSHMAGVHSIAIIATPLEGFIKDLSNFQTSVDAEILTILMRARELLDEQMSLLRQGEFALVSGVDTFVVELKHLHASRIEKQEADSEEQEGFADKYTALFSEALECMTQASDLVSAWQHQGINRDQQEDLVNYLYRLSSTAGEAKYHEIEDLSSALGDYYSKAIQVLTHFDTVFFTLANKAHEELDDMMDMIAAHQLIEPASSLIEELNSAIKEPETEVGSEHSEGPEQAQSSTTAIDVVLLQQLREQVLAADPDILDIFTEEAAELRDVLDALMQDWFQNHKDRSSLGEIKRIIHTLKGGSRLVEIPALGDLTHAYESCLDSADAHGVFDDAFFVNVEHLYKQTVFMIEYIVSGAYKQPVEVPASHEFAFDAENAEPQEFVIESAADELAAMPALDGVDVELNSMPSAVDNYTAAEITFADIETVDEFADMQLPEEIIPVVSADFEFPVAEVTMDTFTQEAEQEPVAGQQFVVLAEQYGNADHETLEIFLEEALELDVEMDELVNQWLNAHDEVIHANGLKRILHTLKGGARLAELGVLGDLTHHYESMIESAEAHRAFDDAFFANVQSYQDQLHSMIEFIANGAKLDDIPVMAATAIVSDDHHDVMEEILTIPAAEEIADDQQLEPEQALELEHSADEWVAVAENAPEMMEAIPQSLEGIEEIADFTAVHDEEVSGQVPAPIAEADFSQQTGTELVAEESLFARLREQYHNADKDTLEIFCEEAMELDAELDGVVSQWLAAHDELTHANSLKRILHTLKGGARLAELGVLGDLTHHYESMIESAEAHRAFDDAFFAGVQSYQDQLHQMIEFILNGAKAEDIPLSAAGVISTVLSAQEEPITTDLQDASVYGHVVAEPVWNAATLVVEDAAGETSFDGVDAAFITLAEQYRSADQDTLEIFMEEALELDSALEEAVNTWSRAHEEIQQADELKRILHTLKGGARLAELSVLGDLTHDYESMIESAEVRKNFGEEFFAGLQSYQDQVHRMIDFLANGAKLDSAPVAGVMTAIVPVMTETFAQTSAPVIDAAAEQVEITVTGTEDVDSELLALFVEEAKEQSEGIEECIANFLKDRTSIAPLDELKRLLHTLKGGARLTGIRRIGDLSHDFETFIINSEREKKTDSGAFVDEMQSFHDRIAKQIAGINVTPVETQDEKKTASNVVPIRPGINAVANVNAALVSQAAIDATRAFIDNFNKDQQRANREPVKITPDLLEDLINLAGEGSIGRSRIEEQMNEIIISQVEMDATVDRLHNQLRRLEIETEAQIVFRQEQVVSEGQENFDPLEMDRYTHMQQLSKSLIESASDLDDISATFTNKMRDMETLLLQQARINTELQEGLMRCQMVPFSRMVPRLRRIVRQVAQELGKRVEFDVENAEGELDRTILERMVAPLEHMLRNAVDHGIEMPEVRKAAGKNPQGTIVLVLSREGGEIVLTLKDDGAGVNIEAVRKKAIERGLMTEDAVLSDHELSQFILHAGFSTAQKVTQISGRGVGMDVVHSEIKQMGGSLDISSRQGNGSIFTVRLPFTVSVNRALMVVVGTDTYAIPLNTIEGIVRVSPYELEAYYQPDAPLFEYAGQSYHLRYMGGLLHRGHRAKLEGLTTPLPVVLIRSSDYTVAVQVDKLLGSREVVVKSLGPQFGMVSGLSGATVLGNGSVVIILDMMALIRADFALGLTQSDTRDEYIPEVIRKITTVMVVDDSVTVRKVTSRLLERFGMKVILAKDGLDALTQLQEMDELPDVMLLDIEMPRMDGFEVVSRVRHDTRLQHIPITMITSRTGDKHRERAISLGANKYLGKPFQERELLQTISELTGAEFQQA